MSGFAYHGVDAATHQERVNEALASGFRPVVLNVSGDPGDPRYAAVWVDGPGPAWWAVHNVNAEQYQTRFDELTAQGFAPRIVSATGPAGGATFAAVFEQGVAEPWFARHELRWDPDTDPDTLTHEINRAYAEEYIPRSLAVYGDPTDRRFAGVWVQNTDAVLWSMWWTSSDDYQRYFDALVEGGMRPAVLSVAPDGWILAVFRGDQVGDWAARHRITAADYQVEFHTRVAAGLRPIAIAAGGVGDDARYAAVFAADDIPTPRLWNVTGADFVGAAALDEAVERFMVGKGIRAGSVAVGRNGDIVGARGYTWAEAGYPVTQPDTRFRIASLSKMFAAAQTGRLVETGRLAWDTPAFPFVGVGNALPPGTPPGGAMNGITVEQLVLRESHLQRDFHQDEQRGVAAAIGASLAPMPRVLLLQYLYGLPLVGALPAGGLYSNAAFFLLTSVIEQATGLPLVNALERDVLRDLGIYDVSVAATRSVARQWNEVATYDHADVHASQLDYAPDAIAPNAYGGGFLLENGAGAGGLLTSAPSITRLIARYPVWNSDATHLTGRELATRYGTLDGTSSGATSRGDGLDFSFVFNRRVSDPEYDEIRDAIHTVLNTYGASL